MVQVSIDSLKYASVPLRTDSDNETNSQFILFTPRAKNFLVDTI